MDTGIISLRYARAIYEYALEEGAEKQVYDNMLEALSNYKTYPAIRKVILDPTLSVDNKLRVLITACGMNINDVTRSAIHLITENKRLNYVENIARMYIEVYRKDKGIKYVQLITSEPASDKTKKELEKMIRSYISCMHMEFITQVDPDILGGFILTINDQRLNASVRDQLAKLRLNLMK